MLNHNNKNLNTSNLKNKQKVYGNNILYQTTLTPNEIIAILHFCYNQSTNAVHIIVIQEKHYDELITIIHKILDNTHTFQTKADIVRAIIRICINNNIDIVGIGLLDIVNNENYGFIRFQAYGYHQSNDDVFISSNMIRQYKLRYADEIQFVINKDSEHIEKRIAANKIILINSLPYNDIRIMKRKVFADLTSIYPNKQVVLADKKYNNYVDMRIIDLFIPIGYGQRMLIIAPPKTGKTTIFKNMACSIGQNKTTKLLLLLIDERPEEVTDFKLNINNTHKCFHSDFNETSYKHTYIAELCCEYAKRLCELGQQVFIFIDSLTRIARAYNCTSSSGNKIMSGGVDLTSLQKAKKLFGIAKNTSEGSISIIATCLLNTGSKMDDVIFEEFKGTSNSDLFLDKASAERGVFPAIEIIKSGTRKHELLLEEKTLKTIVQIKSMLSKTKVNTIDIVIDKIKNTRNNAEFIATIN